MAASTLENWVCALEIHNLESEKFIFGLRNGKKSQSLPFINQMVAFGVLRFYAL